MDDEVGDSHGDGDNDKVSGVSGGDCGSSVRIHHSFRRTNLPTSQVTIPKDTMGLLLTL